MIGFAQRLPKFRLLQAVLCLSVAVMAIAGTIQFPEQAQAVSGQVGAQQVTLNSGGGILANGTDGLRFTINSAASGGSYDSAQAGQDGVVYRGTRQYCCGAGAPYLNIGGTLYGQAGGANSGSVATWSSITVVETSGATTVGTRNATTGNSAATVRYTVVKGGRTYSFDRTVTYTFPNDYVTDSYTFTIPDGNTDTVKFYLGGDTAPGSSDQGYGIMLTSPVRSVISLNTSSHIMFGFREVSGSKIFDGATSQHYSAPYSTLVAGGNLGYVVTASNHDAGLMMQWNLGSTPGTQTASLQQFSTQQGTNLNAAFASDLTQANVPVQLNFSLVNTELTTVSGIAYTATLPTGLTIGSGSQSNTCGGTVTATAGTDSIQLASGSLGAATNCVISVPVVGTTLGTYTLSASNFSGLSALTNNVGTSSFRITDDNDSDGVPNSVESAAPNSGDANNDGTQDNAQLNVASLVNSLTGEYSSLAVDSACELTGVSVKQSSQVGSDSGYSYPLGLFDFSADCGTPGFTTTITQYFYNPPAGSFVLRKFVNGSYQAVTGATMSNGIIAGHPVLLVSYQVVDGGALDDDGLANGVIVDPAGPAVLAAVATPTATPAATATATPSVSVPSTGLEHKNMLPYVAIFILGLLLLSIAPLRRIHEKSRNGA